MSTAKAAEPQPQVNLPAEEISKLNHSERFANKVIAEFNGNIAGGLQVSDYQRQLIQGYFIGIDRALKTTEENRVRKNSNNSDHKYDELLPATWENVNLPELAIDVVHYARMGLDMMQSNHLSPVPFKNKKTNKYDLTLMIGYNGIQYVAEKYALEKPLDVTIELVFETDHFKPIKKSQANKVESYEFEITNAFNRGKVIGGFGYIEYTDPNKNKLIIMTLEAILKRKPKYAAAEFWGGEKDKWENGKKAGKEEIDGWFEEMCLKTLKREVYGAKHIPRDPKKIDDDYQYMKMREARLAEIEVQTEIEQNANSTVIDIEPSAQSQQPPVQPEKTSETQQMSFDTAQSTPAANGPNF